MEKVQETIQRLLDEHREAGRLEGFREGLRTGYEEALHALQVFMKERLLSAAYDTESADQLEDADVIELAPAPVEKPRIRPYQMQAYERLKEHPGITSREAREEWGGSNSVLYQLVRLGLAEKQGLKFYAVKQEV